MQLHKNNCLVGMDNEIICHVSTNINIELSVGGNIPGAWYYNIVQYITLYYYK